MTVAETGDSPGSDTGDESTPHDAGNERTGHDDGGDGTGHEAGGETTGLDDGGDGRGPEASGETAGLDDGGDGRGHDSGSGSTGHDFGGVAPRAAGPHAGEERDEPYDAAFFHAIHRESYASACVVMSRVIGLTGARSVVDVGCGSGAWTRACGEVGVPEVVGVDGAAVPAERRAHATSFVEHDLSEPLRLGRSFDLAICVEVAERLPPERAPGLVADLAALAPVVLFSAAVPGQGGTGQGGTGHLNEQWSEYWVALWEAEGWTCRDAIRPWVRAKEEVAWWYRQNLYLATSRSAGQAYTSFPQLSPARPEHPVDYMVRPWGDVMVPPAPPPVIEAPPPEGEATDVPHEARAGAPDDGADQPSPQAPAPEENPGATAMSDAARPGTVPADVTSTRRAQREPVRRDEDEHPKPPGWEAMRRAAGRLRRRTGG